jgi:lysophospholipase L1-like esterase
MGKFLHFLFTIIKWVFIVAMSIEILGFLFVSLTNKIIYGSMWEGGYQVKYDPYVLFLSGPRPTSHNSNRPGQNHRTLWLFGGSTMRGQTDQDDQTIPSFLAGMLNQPDSRFSYTIVNFGEDSYNSLLETKYLQKELIQRSPHPDLIIFYDGANDCSYTAQHRTPDGHYGYRRFTAMVENYRRSFFGLLKSLNAALYCSFTKELYDKMMQTAVPISPGSQLVRESVGAVQQRYDHVRKLAHCYGAGFLVFWQPILWVETGTVLPQVREQEKQYAIMAERFLSIRHNFSVLYEALAQGLEGKSYFINFQQVLCSRTEPTYRPDGVHLNDVGREMVAREMNLVLRKWLQENKAISSYSSQQR